MLGNRKQLVNQGSNSEETHQVFASGEVVLHSGLYKLRHDSHNVEKEIFIRKGTSLPACNDCGKPVSFILVREVEHIDEDPDFQ